MYNIAAAVVFSAVLMIVGAAEETCVVNDNYCDCGDDEPETNACSFYSSDLFHCKSKVFTNQRIPLSRVDDGICDCCDGSDESIGCDNNCMALEKLRLEAEEEEKNRKEAGIKAQTQLKAEANSLYTAKVAEGLEAKNRAAELVAQIENAKGEVSSLSDAEYKENQAAVVDTASLVVDFKAQFSATLPREGLLRALLHGSLQGGQHLLESLILNAEVRVKANGGTVDTEKANEDLHTFTTLRESCQADSASASTIAEQFQVIANSLNGHLSLDVLDRTTLGDLTFDLFEKLHTDCERGLLFSRGNDVAIAFDSACQLFSSFHKKKAELMQPVEELQAKLSAARETLKTLEADLKSVKLKASDYDDIVKKDFGPDNLMFLFYKKCYEMSIDKYYYSICPFGVAKQDSTTLGKFDSLERLNNQIIFKFTYGDHCFATKRPRDLSLSMRCGREPKLVEISEPETCSYAAVLESPLAC